MNASKDNKYSNFCKLFHKNDLTTRSVGGLHFSCRVVWNIIKNMELNTWLCKGNIEQVGVTNESTDKNAHIIIFYYRLDNSAFRQVINGMPVFLFYMNLGFSSF